MKASKKQYLLAAAIFLLGCAVSAWILFHPFSTSEGKGNKVTVTFYASDGAELESRTANEGDTIVPPDYSEEGYFFKGWSESGTEFYPILEDVQAVKNAVYADYRYAKSGGAVALTVQLAGQVDCSDITVTMAYDGELLRFQKAADLPEGITVTDDAESGVLTIHGASDTPWESPAALATLHFRMKGNGSYETTLPLRTQEIYTLQGSEKVYTDSTAYDSALYFISK